MTGKKLLTFSLLLTLFVACSHHQSSLEHNGHQVMATLWVQNAAEYRALCYQSYFQAETILKEKLKKAGKNSRPKAVVMDIDETILDNSPYQAKGILEGQTFSEKSWDNWIQLKRAKLIPGAKKFILAAKQLGVEIILISNRSIKNLKATYENLADHGLPIKRENIFLKTTSESKDQRRNHILDQYQVLISIGDTLADFNVDFEGVALNERNILIERNRPRFGQEFVLLPNPMYGDWINAIYRYERDLDLEEAQNVRLKHLFPYEL